MSMPDARTIRRSVCVALLCVAAAADADNSVDLERAKMALVGVQKAVIPDHVNRFEHERRFAIWSNYYALLEHYWQMQVHLEMMRRHGADRQAEFDATRDAFSRSLDTLRQLLSAGDA